MFNLWMSNFDVGTSLLLARGLFLIYYSVNSEKTVLKSAKNAFLQDEFGDPWRETFSTSCHLLADLRTFGKLFEEVIGAR